MMQRTQPTTPKKIVLTGLGPTGLAFLAAMLDNAKRTPDTHYDIHIFEERQDFMARQQRLVDLKSGAIANEASWESFLTHLFKLNAYVTDAGALIDRDHLDASPDDLTARQTFIRKLLRYEKAATCRQLVIKNFSIKSLQTALLEHIKTTEDKVDNVSLHWHIGTRMEESHFMDNADTLFVQCTGNHHTTDHKQPFANQLPPYNAAYLFEVTLPKESMPFSLSREEVAKQLIALGWEPASERTPLPLFVLDHNLHKKNLEMEKWQPKAFVVSELPAAMTHMPDASRQQAILAWMTMLAAYQLQLPPTCFKVKTHSLFQTEARSVDNPILTLPNGAQVIRLGDDSMSSIYQAGFSSGIGLNEALVAAACITHPTVENQCDFEPLLQVYRAYQQRIEQFLAQSPYSKPYACFFQPIHQAQDQHQVDNRDLQANKRC